MQHALATFSSRQMLRRTLFSWEKKTENVMQMSFPRVGSLFSSPCAHLPQIHAYIPLARISQLFPERETNATIRGIGVIRLFTYDTSLKHIPSSPIKDRYFWLSRLRNSLDHRVLSPLPLHVKPHYLLYQRIPHARNLLVSNHHRRPNHLARCPLAAQPEFFQRGRGLRSGRSRGGECLREAVTTDVYVVCGRGYIGCAARRVFPRRRGETSASN